MVSDAVRMMNERKTPRNDCLEFNSFEENQGEWSNESKWAREKLSAPRVRSSIVEDAVWMMSERVTPRNDCLEFNGFLRESRWVKQWVEMGERETSSTKSLKFNGPWCKGVEMGKRGTSSTKSLKFNGPWRRERKWASKKLPATMKLKFKGPR